MSTDPESEATTEAQDALEPRADDGDAEDQLGDAGTSKGSGFINPIGGL